MNEIQIMKEQLLLDENILLWVFIPITYVTILVALARVLLTLYFAATAVKTPVKSSSKAATVDKLTVGFCDQLAKKSMLLTPQAFNARRSFLCKNEIGYLIKEGDRPPVAPEQNIGMMGSMMDQMKGSMVMILTNIPVMAWINYFFAGFVLAQTPFSLTQKFRSMTQAGIDLQNLDASYVSGVSFYFLIVFGMNQINTLLLSDDMENEQAIDQQRKAMNPMGAGMGGPGIMDMMGQGTEKKQIFKPQIDLLNSVTHRFAFDEAPALAQKKLDQWLATETSF